MSTSAASASLFIPSEVEEFIPSEVEEFIPSEVEGRMTLPLLGPSTSLGMMIVVRCGACS